MLLILLLYDISDIAILEEEFPHRGSLGNSNVRCVA